MPELRLISASGTAQRRLLEETLHSLQDKGYVLSARQEGGEWSTLLSDNMSGGLFDSERVVVVDSAALMGAMQPALASMVEEKSSVIIILIYDTDPFKAKLLPKEIAKKCVVLKPEEFPRWPRERQMWVENLARTMGLELERDAAALIVELTDDPEEIRGELKSLSMLKHDRPVGTHDVELMCLDDGSRNLLRLLDGLCTGDSSGAMGSLISMAKEAKAGSLIILVTSLHNRMRLAWYAAMNTRNGALFARSLGARDYAWRMAGQAARRYGAEALGKYVLGLIKININEKSGAGAGWNDLETLTIELMGK